MREVKEDGRVHTPGPWTAEFLGSPRVVALQKDGRYMPICDLRGWGYLTGNGALGLPYEQATEIQDANARLIAAAPEMLKALENVQRLIAEAAMAGFNWKDGDWADRLFASQQVTSAALSASKVQR